jgi:hypothetical protein
MPIVLPRACYVLFSSHKEPIRKGEVANAEHSVFAAKSASDCNFSFRNYPVDARKKCCYAIFVEKRITLHDRQPEPATTLTRLNHL